MTERLAANTETLRKQFPAVYRDFFASSQRVASASNAFLWTGEFTGFYGGITVAQKLPIRSYVGFQTTHNHEVTVEREYSTFDATQQRFIRTIADDQLCQNIQQYLADYYQTKPDFTGLTVRFLTEVPLGHSLGSNGAITAALALLLADDSDFDTVFFTARQILAHSQAGHSSGVTTYMALADIQGPVAFSSDSKTYMAKPVNQLAGQTASLIWPIDFGLIYSGIQTNAESVILANDRTVQELEHDTKRLSRLLERKLNFRETYLAMLNMTASLTILAFVDLFQKGAHRTALEQLFNSMNQYQNLLHILHVSNSVTDLIYSRIHQLANKQQNDVGSGVKISGIGKGGAILFAMPYGMHRETIVRLIEQLRAETGRPIWLDYASWLDGIGGQPGRIEQDIAIGNLSSFLQGDRVQVTIIDRGATRSEVIALERLPAIAREIDILLDKTTEKILIRGQSVTSKELVSQKATVSILSALVAAGGYRLTNDKLPASYGTSRYDLQGKIILPLIKLVKKRTNRDLQVSIGGGSYDDYILTLNPLNVVIGILEEKR